LKFLHDPSLSGEKTPAEQAAIDNAAQAVKPSSASPSGTQNVAAANASPKESFESAAGSGSKWVRPYLKFRMPTFTFSPNELQTLVRFFHGYVRATGTLIKEPLQPLSEQESW